MAIASSTACVPASPPRSQVRGPSRSTSSIAASAKVRVCADFLVEAFSRLDDTPA